MAIGRWGTRRQAANAGIVVAMEDGPVLGQGRGSAGLDDGVEVDVPGTAFGGRQLRSLQGQRRSELHEGQQPPQGRVDAGVGAGDEGAGASEVDRRVLPAERTFEIDEPARARKCLRDRVASSSIWVQAASPNGANSRVRWSTADSLLSVEDPRYRGFHHSVAAGSTGWAPALARKRVLRSTWWNGSSRSGICKTPSSS